MPLEIGGVTETAFTKLADVGLFSGVKIHVYLQDYLVVFDSAYVIR